MSDTPDLTDLNGYGACTGPWFAGAAPANTATDGPPPMDVPPPTDSDAPPGMNGASGRKPRKHRPKPVPEVSELWEQRLTRDRDGLMSSVGNVQLILTHHAEWKDQLRYDIRADKLMLQPGAPIACESDPRELKDSDYARLAVWLEHSQYQIIVSPGSAAISGALAIVAERHSYDPVHDYLDSLTWDGTQRLDGMLLGYFGAELKGGSDEQERQARYLAAVGSKFMISAVARTEQPGCKVDCVLTLRGPQGTRKSSAFKVLAGERFFADSVPELKSRDAADYLRGTWIVELAELDTLGRAELSTCKAFLSRSEDRFRAAYGRTTQTHPRRCVFGGSTNEDAYLRDATGNRRFWPVSVCAIDTDAIERDRDQLWAEAVHRYRAGEPWHLTDLEVIETSIAVQEEHAVTDVWQPTIEGWISGQPRVAVPEILEKAIGLELPRCDQIAMNRVARVLTQLGWTKARVREGGRLKWVYCAPTGGCE